MAADALRPIYDQTEGRDGYISLEVSPYLAMDTEGTIEEARRLWREVDARKLDGQDARGQNQGCRRSGR